MWKILKSIEHFNRYIKSIQVQVCTVTNRMSYLYLKRVLGSWHLIRWISNLFFYVAECILNICGNECIYLYFGEQVEFYKFRFGTTGYVYARILRIWHFYYLKDMFSIRRHHVNLCTWVLKSKLKTIFGFQL